MSKLTPEQRKAFGECGVKIKRTVVPKNAPMKNEIHWSADVGGKLFSSREKNEVILSVLTELGLIVLTELGLIKVVDAEEVDRLKKALQESRDLLELWKEEHALAGGEFETLLGCSTEEMKDLLSRGGHKTVYNFVKDQRSRTSAAERDVSSLEYDNKQAKEQIAKLQDDLRVSRDKNEVQARLLALQKLALELRS